MTAPFIAERFFAKVNQTDDCWLWVGCKRRKGYGAFRVGGQMVAAHRWAWEQANGPIPEGMFVCHRCDVPACVRIDHLFLGTHLDNVRDARGKGRGNAGRTHCPQGHEYDADNTYTHEGKRYCRSCVRERSRAHQARRRASA